MEVTKPVKMSDETVKKLEEIFALDGTVEEACFWAKISKQTYYNWIDSFPEMKERFDAIRQEPFLKARRTIIKSLENPQFAFEYMRRKKKDEFSDRQEVTGKDGKSVIITGINYITPDGNKSETTTETAPGV